jgi:hypothetical protein
MVHICRIPSRKPWRQNIRFIQPEECNNISDNELTGREGNFERRARFVRGFELEGRRSYAPMGVKL